MAPAGLVVSPPSSRPGEVWRLAIEHTTTYRYSARVRASYNEIRAIPQTNRHQTALESRVVTTPTAPLYRYRDYWGTQVLAFDVAGEHDLLQVRSEAVVETRAETPSTWASWDDVAAVRDRFAELCSPSAYTALDEELARLAAAMVRDQPAGTIEAVASWVHDTVEYAAGTTGVGTTALEAWRAERGVCQDFAHLSLALLRGAGIPARYVSGYLHPDERANIGEEAVGESHAWVEAWSGDWLGVDPTNGVPAGLRHVVVATGRDYADVAPVKGVYAGAAEDDLSVEVKVTRVA